MEEFYREEKCADCTNTSQVSKPPIGLKPRWIHDAQRLQEIINAMKRFSEVDMAIPLEWIDELEELIKNRG